MAVKSTAYRDNPLLKKVGVNVNYTQEQVEEYIRCSKDPVYFARHMKIITLDHGLMPFAMYDFQKDMIRMFNDNRFVITKCPRQIGKCLSSDTKIKLLNKTTGVIMETTIGEFYEQQNAARTTNILPEKQIYDSVERKFIDSIDIGDEWEIESDLGWVPITHIHKTIEYQEWYIETIDGQSLICADTHIVFDENMCEVFVKDLIPNTSYIMTRFGPKLVSVVLETDASSNMFDATVDSDEHRFYSADILSHNTTVSVAFLLWTVLFQDSQNIAILANKGQTARDILGKLQLAYENLPIWLQQGIITWNKSFIELENGSKIVASSTSSSAARSGSYNCVSGESMIQYIDDHDNKHENTIESMYNNQENISNIESDSDMINNKYKKWYFDIIDCAKLRKCDPLLTYEYHHIIPKSISGDNTHGNMVYLTLKEHFICHKLLIRIYQGKYKAKMVYALYMMSNTRKGLKMSSKEYSNLRLLYSQAQKERVISPEECEFFSQKMIKYWAENKEEIKKHWENSGRNKRLSDSLTGVKKSSEHMDKINKNPEKIRKTAEKHTGMKRTDVTKKNQSIAKHKTISENGTEWLGKGQKYITNTKTNELIRVPVDYELKDNEVFGNKSAGKSIKGNKWYHNPNTNEIKCFPENCQPEGFLIGRGKR